MRELSLIALIGMSLGGCAAEPSPIIEELAYTPGVPTPGTRLRTAHPHPPASGTCSQGRDLCDGVCVDTRSDVNNCGECGHQCPYYPYSNSICQGHRCFYTDSCIAGRANCDRVITNGCETDLLNDAMNCGACGNTCASGELCAGGACSSSCAAGTGNCDGDTENGCETNTSIDPANCGSCGVACTGGNSCVAGTCQLSACDPATEVELGGHCYYLDGSGGACDGGYQLASQSVLSRGIFTGRTYKHAVSDNCCVYNADPDEDWGMQDHCAAPGPFTGGDPTLGAVGCINATQLEPAQLTLCYR
jgi:hypothetical protein